MTSNKKNCVHNATIIEQQKQLSEQKKEIERLMNLWKILVNIWEIAIIKNEIKNTEIEVAKYGTN